LETKKIFQSVILVLLIIANLYCKNESHDTVNDIPYNSLTVRTAEFKDFFNSGIFQKVVKLDSGEKSIIGTIDQVITANNGDIYVGDFDSAKKIFRFNSKGAFITNFGRPGHGPSEYIQIENFTLTDDDSIIILSSDKLIKFDKSGNFQKERRIDFLGKDMVSIKNRIYIAVDFFKKERSKKNALLVFDLELREQDGLFEFDKRMEKYCYSPVKRLAENNEGILFTDKYDLRLRLYDPRDNHVLQLRLPNENSRLNAIWEKKNFTEDDRTTIKKNIHRFNMVFRSGDFLFLNEFCLNKNIYDYWVLDLTGKKLLVFKYPDSSFFEENLFFNRIVGSYEKGIIFVFNNPEEFDKYKKDYPGLRDISFTNEDNPLLCFFQFKPI